MLLSLRLAVCLLLSALVAILTIDTAIFRVTIDTATKSSSTANTTKAEKAVHPRPRNLRLVFLGDSVTRYQYLSLAYFLRYGRWFDPSIQVNNIVAAHTYHHPLHPDEDWNEFFLQSNRVLHPLEACDCLRSWNGEILVERRYFFDEELNNMLVYINMNGNKTNPGRGYYGRLNAEDIFGPDFDRLVGLPLGMGMHDMADTSDTLDSIEWEYSTWGDVIRHHVGKLDLGYNMEVGVESYGQPENAHVILNAGLHTHNFRDNATATNVVEALDDIHLSGTWKTTTYTREYVIELQNQQRLTRMDHYATEHRESLGDAATTNPATLSYPHVCTTGIATCAEEMKMNADSLMCRTLGRCFNVSWTVALKPDRYYFDSLHFVEPVYRVFNEDMLSKLGMLPPGYAKFNRTKLLQAGGGASGKRDKRNDDDEACRIWNECY